MIIVKKGLYPKNRIDSSIDYVIFKTIKVLNLIKYFALIFLLLHLHPLMMSKINV